MRYKGREREYMNEHRRKWRKTEKGRAWERRRTEKRLSTGQEQSRQLRRQLANAGWTVERYYKVLAEQNGVCAICKRPPKSHRLSADHNHRTGEPRGLLCWYCNYRVLGSIESHRVNIYDVVNYIEKWKIM